MARNIEGGIFSFSLGETQSFVTISKEKNPKKNKGKNECEVQSPFDVHNMPSKDCKQFLVEFMVKFYEENSAIALGSKFIRYGEESMNKFKTELEACILQALHIPR